MTHLTKHAWRVFTVLIAVAIIAIALLGIPGQAGAAARPKPCVGTVVRKDIPGVEIVKRSDTTLCSRPAGGSPQRTQVRP